MSHTSAASVLAIVEDTYREWLAAVERSGLGPEAAATPAAAAKLAPGRRSVGAVAVIPVRGFLAPKPSLISMLFGGTSTEGLTREVATAMSDPSVAAVVLDIDSPGGLVQGVPEAAADLRGMRGSKPLLAVANPTAASAAFWLAAQADEVAVTPSGFVGSVGVAVVHVEESARLAKEGVKVTALHYGERKVDGAPWAPLSEDARASIQEKVDLFGHMFESDVARGRRVSVDVVRARYGKGATMTAAQAKAAGVADRIATLDEIVALAARGYRPRAAVRAYDARELEAWAALTGVKLGVRGARHTDRSTRRVYDPAELRAWARLAGIEDWRRA